MVQYNAHLKANARQLRKHLTDREAALWSRLRNNQLLGIQVYRQQPSGEPSGEFFAPRAHLVGEGEGAPHLGGEHALQDRPRDGSVGSRGLKVLRFNRREVLKESDAVVEAIYRAVAEQLNAEIPPGPPLIKGG